MNALHDRVVLRSKSKALEAEPLPCNTACGSLAVDKQCAAHQDRFWTVVTWRDSDGTARFEAIQATKHGRTKLCSCFCASRNHGEVGVREVIEGSIGK